MTCYVVFQLFFLKHIVKNPQEMKNDDSCYDLGYFDIILHIQKKLTVKTLSRSTQKSNTFGDLDNFPTLKRDLWGLEFES